MHDRRDRRQRESMKVAFNLESNKARGDNRMELVTAAGAKVTGSAAKSVLDLQLAIEGPRGASFRPQRPGIVLGVTTAIAGEGKSTHALAFARTAALAGETIPASADTLGANRQAGRLEVRPRDTCRDRSDDPAGGPTRVATAAGSDIQRLYEKYRG